MQYLRYAQMKQNVLMLPVRRLQLEPMFFNILQRVRPTNFGYLNQPQLLVQVAAQAAVAHQAVVAQAVAQQVAQVAAQQQAIL